MTFNKLILKSSFGLLLLFSIIRSATCNAQDVYNLKYPEDPASKIQPGVPKGEILQFNFNDSKIYPGTNRTFWVYVPAQYKPGKPACLFVCMDGIQFNSPVVFDNLIAKGEMPVTIGVYVGSGTITKNGKDIRYNRSNEFDNMSDRFSHFLLEELLPEVEKKKTADGRTIRLSKEAKDRAIAGTSSGAICAFTAAWHRPDAFSRVFSSIGTYVGMRGGDQYPVLIRKTEPKSIRVFLVDNFHDSWNPLFGNWYMENVDMEAAFNFSGYEVRHSWMEGGHDNVQADALFPDAMRWLWKGWPAAVRSGPSANNMLKSILDTGEKWKPVDIRFKIKGNIDADPNGGILCSDSAGTIYKINPDDNATPFLKTGIKDNYITGNADGGLNLISRMAKGISVHTKNGEKKILKSDMHVEGIIGTKNGGKYVISNSGDGAGHLWLLKSDGTGKIVDESNYLGKSMAISPEGSLLYVTEKYSNWICSYVIQPDGTLTDKQRFYWLHNIDNDTQNDIQSMAVDNGGNLYVATPMGVQVCDQNGRVRAILSLPGGAITALSFGGEKMDALYVVCAGKLYKRKLKVQGIPAWAAPVAVTSQGAG